MYRFILFEKKIYVYDKSDKDFREKYGKNFEQIGTVKDRDSIDTVAEKLSKQYKCTEIIKDCHIKRKSGWKYYSDELKAQIRESMSKTRRGKALTEQQKQSMSKSKLGKRSNNYGKKRPEVANNITSLRQLGNKAGLGTRWCHNPVTKKERMVREVLPEGFVWGRDPDLEVHRTFPWNN